MESKKQKVLKKKRGRRNLYNEPTITLGIAVPISKKGIIKEVVEAMLERYKIKK